VRVAALGLRGTDRSAVGSSDHQLGAGNDEGVGRFGGLRKNGTDRFQTPPSSGLSDIRYLLRSAIAGQGLGPTHIVELLNAYRRTPTQTRPPSTGDVSGTLGGAGAGAGGAPGVAPRGI